MAWPQRTRRISEAEYLSGERTAEFKSEFFDGETFAMAGGTPQRSLIALNAASELRNALKEGPCIAYNADLRIKIEATGLYTYPDVSVICGPVKLASGTNDTATNPTLIVEVLSDSTEAYDRGMKFDHYRQIPSLKEYLLVSQNSPQIVQYIRQGDKSWLMKAATGLEAEIDVSSLGVKLGLREVFSKVEFVPGPMRK